MVYINGYKWVFSGICLDQTSIQEYKADNTGYKS